MHLNPSKLIQFRFQIRLDCCSMFQNFEYSRNGGIFFDFFFFLNFLNQKQNGKSEYYYIARCR